MSNISTNGAQEYDADMRLLKVHDHPCTVYETAEECKRQFVPYLQAGLLLGERCIYFVHDTSPEFIMHAMKEDGFNIEPYLFKKAFLIINTRDVHLSDGHFGEEKMMSHWLKAVRDAKEAGFPAVRAAVEMTWALSGLPGCDGLAPYEAKLNKFINEHPISVICQYHRLKFPADKLKAVIHAHPLCVANESVYENPACVPPEKFVDGSDHMDVQAMLDNLQVIRQLKEAKVELETATHAEASLQAFVAGVKDYAIFLLDARGNVISWNEGAHNIKGYTKEEILGKHFSIFYPEELKAKGHPQHELDIARQVGRYEEEGWRIRKDGTKFWANVLITARHDEDGKVIGFAKITRDLTERRMAEEAREEMAKRVLQLNEELQKLAFTISHELQEPIRNMTSYSSLLEARYVGRLGKDADECLEHIVSAAKRTEQLVNDLWTYARITRPNMVKAPTDLAAVVREAQAGITELIFQSKCVLTVQPYESFPTIEANKEQLVFVIEELIRNAIKHRNGSTPHLEIRIGVKQEDDGWTLTCADNGPGIDRFFAKQVFDAYRRLDGKPGESGSGMGLPICKKIMEQHSGKITFESAAGSGTTFYLWLPSKQIV